MTCGPRQLISVVDYGVSNLGSIRNMLRKLGFDVEIVSTPDAVGRATKIILPGVGAFDNGAMALEERGLFGPLQEKARDPRVPFLGICLGMQLLGKGSEEGSRAGLGLIEGTCVRLRFPPAAMLKVPHMGWNVPIVKRPNPLITDAVADARYYFTHSYHLVCEDPADVAVTVTHGIEFTAMIHRANVMGVQFHPEKSHRYGMSLLRNFGALPC
jgi:imidazole glycerol-phosphate synthase subunit HisH